MLAVSPRIFADAFFNAKDIPLMVAFTWAVCSIVFLTRSIQQGRGWLQIGIGVLLTAITMAMALSTRILGIFLVAVFVLIMFILLIQAPKRWLRITGLTALTLAGMLAFTMWFWPIMRTNPLGGLVTAFTYMSHYPYNPPNLYFGTFIDAAKLPWHYLPVWMSITNPLLVVIGVVIGLTVIMFRFISETGLNKAFRNTLTFILNRPDWVAIMAWGFGPIAAIILFKSILYDGWRQVFFIYPAFVLLACAGIQAIYRLIPQNVRWQKPIQFALTGLIVIGLAEPVWFMVRQHPHENVYFNQLAGDPATLRYRFEMDYWGLSYKQAIDALLEMDQSEQIKINVENSPGRSYLRYMLTPDQARRVKMVNSPESADYYITNYRLTSGRLSLPGKSVLHLCARIRNHGGV